MDKFKRIIKVLLFPHIAAMLLLIPVATAFLLYAMLILGTETVPAYISYALAAYTLAVWCCRIPRLVTFCKTFKNENKYAVRLQEDVRLRVNISLWGSFLFNAAYAALQFCLGYTQRSFWFFTLAGYYLLLALMRFYLVGHTQRYRLGEQMQKELKKYRSCGWIFLVMNLSLAMMIFFMVYFNRTFVYDEITAIAMAAYTFTAFTVAIVNVVKYRKYNSPVYSASKAISFASACVSMITLTSALMTTFGGSEDQLMRRAMLASVGGGVSLLVIAMAGYMILRGTKQLKVLISEGLNE